jgi:1-acyl-sn-glycerol-3-phosphate acyltransferase
MTSALKIIKFIFRWITFEFNQKFLKDDDYWGPIRLFVTKLWMLHAKLWHGYELIGLENIPKKGPALIIYYHGTFPIDHYYIVFKVYESMRRLIYTVGARFLFKIPGTQSI